MKKISSLIGVGMLLCCLFAVRAQAALTLIPDVTYDRVLTYDGSTWTGLGSSPDYWDDTSKKLTIANIADPLRIKEIYIGMVNWITTEVTSPSPNTVTGPFSVPSYPNAKLWIITPQPDIEYIQFDSSTWASVSSIEIGINCVPEPSTVFAGMGALGVLGLFGWRNRK